MRALSPVGCHRVGAEIWISRKPKCIGTHIFVIQITLRYPMFIVNLACVTMLDQIKVKNTFEECV